MNIRTKIIILFLAANLFSCKGIVQETENKSHKTAVDFSKIEKIKEAKNKGLIINDYVNIFNAAQKEELSDIINDYYKKTTRQIVVVTVDNITPYTDILVYATDLGNYWGVGDATKNNGVTIVLCNSCRQVGIATGTGTQLILTDQICKEIIDETMIPEFKNGDFYNGIKKGIAELIHKWE